MKSQVKKVNRKKKKESKKKVIQKIFLPKIAQDIVNLLSDNS